MHIYSPLEIEQIAASKGMSVNALCKEAKVARSTFTRAKAGETQFSGSTLKKFATVLESTNSSGNAPQ